MRFLATAVLAIFLIPSLAVAQVSLGDGESTFGRTIQVHATGTAAENGAALVAALGSATITDRSDPATERVLVQLGPGIYEVGADITMPDAVGLRGAGFGLTTVICEACTSTLICNGTFNWVSDLAVISGIHTISVAGGGYVQLDAVQSSGPVGVKVEGRGTIARINNSLLSSPEDGEDALFIVDGATVSVAFSEITGGDFTGDGIATGYNTTNESEDDPTLYVLYTYIGVQGVRNPWPGILSCVYISSGFPVIAEVPGCPQALGTGTLRLPPHSRLNR